MNKCLAVAVAICGPILEILRISSRYFYNKPENQDKDALGKIEQQQALSFWNCSQHEWEPQMISMEKGHSNAKKAPIGGMGGYQEQVLWYKH